MRLNLSKISKAFGERVLFSDVSLEIGDHDKIGFVGANGAGKTTLFQILLNQLTPDSGEVFRNRDTRLGYMSQHAGLESDRTVWDELMTVFAPLQQLEQELETIAYDIQSGAGDVASMTQRQHMLSEQYEAAGGFTYQSVAKASLMGLGFTQRECSMPFAQLSGGQKTRVMLCKILLSDANLLLLDEPTNHLDIASVEWLEGFLRDYKGAFVVISHDRYFLNRVANRMLELEHGRIVSYRGNYDDFLRLKEENQRTLERQYQNTQKEIKRIEGIIEQQRRWNREKNIKTAESKQKQIDRLQAGLVKPENAPAGIDFTFRTRPGGGRDVLICEEVAMGFDGKHLFRQLNLHITKGERVFLLGPNGCGKTTLLRLITGSLTPPSGTIQVGANIQIGYYDQTQESLDFSKTVMDEVHDAYPAMTDTEVRNALACFLFRGDDVFKQIADLSGGERAKVSLCKLMLSGANFLLLDEPTNHLDVSSREALENALLGYNGTLLLVSHDRYFINKLADRVCYMDVNGLTAYLGNYDTFLEKRAPHAAPAENKTAMASGRESYQQQKQREAERRRVENHLRKTEEAIAQAEQELNALQADLEQCGADYIKAAELTQQTEEAEHRLEQLYADWEELSAQQEQMV